MAYAVNPCDDPLAAFGLRQAAIDFYTHSIKKSIQEYGIKYTTKEELLQKLNNRIFGDDMDEDEEAFVETALWDTVCAADEFEQYCMSNPTHMMNLMMFMDDITENDKDDIKHYIESDIEGYDGYFDPNETPLTKYAFVIATSHYKFEDHIDELFE